MSPVTDLETAHNYFWSVGDVELVSRQFQLGREFGGASSGVGPHLSECASHDVGLFSEREIRRDGCDQQSASENNQPPIGRRFLFSAIGAVASFIGCFWGRNQIRSGSRLLGSAAIVLGDIWLSGGLFLLWLINFQDTWNWWL
jgi:hypothetical protein